MVDSTETMDANDLAKMLKRAPDTIRTDARRRPGTLPPRLKVPGSGRLLWLKDDVKAWLESLRRPNVVQLPMSQK
jgi:hypothetical protein